MAQTLDPRALTFKPPLEQYDLGLKRLLPHGLLVSPRAGQGVNHFEPFTHCRSPRRLADSLLSFDGCGWDTEASAEEQLKQEYLKMERERDLAYGRLKSHDRRSAPARFSPQRTTRQVPTRTAATQRPFSVPSPMTREQSTANRTGPLTPKAQYDMECLLHLVRSQLEFYFSDKNLFEELHSNLMYYMKLDSEQCVPVHVLLDLPQVAKLTSEKEVVLQALRSSTLLELNKDESKCRRPNYTPPADYKVRKNLRRSVLVYGVPQQMTDERIRRLLDMHGNILCVAFAGMDEGPDPEISSVIMKKKFNDVNIQGLKAAFVVFESQSQANKCVKARSRNSIDGIRTMHKYDYNKVVKRLGKGQSPSFAPVNPRQGVTNFSNTSPVNTFQHNTKNKQAPYVMKKHQLNHGFRQTNFRSQKWRSPTKESDSLNWRNNKPMRQRTNSIQNRTGGVASGMGFSRSRFSKENLNAYPVY